MNNTMSLDEVVALMMLPCKMSFDDAYIEFVTDGAVGLRQPYYANGIFACSSESRYVPLSSVAVPWSSLEHVDLRRSHGVESEKCNIAVPSL